MLLSPLTTVFKKFLKSLSNLSAVLCILFFFLLPEIFKNWKRTKNQSLPTPVKYVNSKCICIISFHKIRCILRQIYLSVRVTDKHFNSYSWATFPLENPSRFSAQICIKVGKICQTALY